MRILFRPEARTEALEARAWHEARSVGLGLEFARSLDAAIATAFRNPAAYSLVEGDCRRILLRKFPFSLVHRVRADEFVVIAIFHHRRSPLALAPRVDG